MGIGRYESIFQDFQLYAKPLADRTVRWEPMGKHSIKAFLNDGRIIQFNGLMRTYRSIVVDDNAEWTEELFRKKFAINLAGLMYENGYTQDIMAEALGISRKMLYRYLHREATPSAYTMTKIARLLDCNVSDLLQD
jgi:DNA-binding XRE family transcriptional regulator